MINNKLQIKSKYKVAFGIILLLLICFLLFLVFSGQIILPQFFSLGPLSVHYYGLTMALAVFVGYMFAIKRAERYGIAKTQAEDLVFYIVLGGFVGARVYHIFSSFSYYFQHPLESLMVWRGGLSIYGAILGGVAVILVYKKISNFQFPIFNYFDLLTPAIILGQVVGRFGNLFNYEAFGYPTNLPWKMFVPAIFRPESFENFSFFHPWFLYEQIGNFLILLILLFIERKQGAKIHLFLYYLLLYNTLRFGLEFLRIDSVFIGHFRQNAFVSLGFACFALLYIIKNLKSR